MRWDEMGWWDDRAWRSCLDFHRSLLVSDLVSATRWCLHPAPIPGIFGVLGQWVWMHSGMRWNWLERGYPHMQCSKEWGDMAWALLLFGWDWLMLLDGMRAGYITLLACSLLQRDRQTEETTLMSDLISGTKTGKLGKEMESSARGDPIGWDCRTRATSE